MARRRVSRQISPQRRIRRWLWVGTGGVLGTLILAAIAPVFLNSAWPWVGVLLWSGILGGWVVSGARVVQQLLGAIACHRCFIRQFPEWQFPEYRNLNVLTFLGLSPEHVEERLQQYLLAAEDPDFESLEIMPLDFVRGGLQ
jgi:hypothetical protein